MKKLNTTKKHYMESKYFQKKYGKLKFVSESGKLFRTDKGRVIMFKESSGDDREFTYKGVTITRYDYESLPSPMAASKFSDEKMQEIAKDIYFELVNRGWDEKEIQKYVNNVDDYELPDAEMRIADKIRSDWWEAMEDVARYHGMEYYEDMDDEALVNESDDGSAWFDERGDMLKTLPGACIMACSGQGRVDDDVDYWTRELGFDVDFPVDRAVKYLEEYGAWDDLDLLADITKTADRKKMSEWFRTNGDDEDLSKLMLDPAGFATKVLAHRVLWIFCNDLKELAYEMMDDETSLVSDWGDPSTWGDDEWERFQKEYSYCSLNN